LQFNPNWQAFLASILSMSLFLLAGLYLLAVVAFLRGTNCSLSLGVSSKDPASFALSNSGGLRLGILPSVLIWRHWLSPVCRDLLTAAPNVGYTSSPLAYATEHNSPPRRANCRLSLFAAAIFSAIYVVQAFSWRTTVTRFDKVLSAAPRPYITLAELPWAQNTALEHWGSVPLSAILQGRARRVLFAMRPEDFHVGDIAFFPGDSLDVKMVGFLLARRASVLERK
jgi:hypothetical protein